jgi:hypothetical protein
MMKNVRCFLSWLLIVMTLCVSSACSFLFDAPSFGRSAREQAASALEEAVQEQNTEMMQTARDRIGDWILTGEGELQRVITFPFFGGTDEAAGRGWPVMRVNKVAAQSPPQLVLESPMRGMVFLDDREIGLVQDGSARIVTLTPGEHQIRIEQPQVFPMVAQFFIETGERITLRWESR